MFSIFSKMMSFDIYRYFQIITPVIAFIMGMNFIIYIAGTKRFHVITSVAWMLFLFCPIVNILTLPAFWIFLIVKEIKRDSIETAPCNPAPQDS